MKENRKAAVPAVNPIIYKSLLKNISILHYSML